MNIAVTGATGFLGRYIVKRLIEDGHTCRCWFRSSSDRSGFDHLDAARLTWVEGELSRPDSNAPLLEGCDAIVHSALYRPGAGFRGAEGDVALFVERNVLGTVRLIAAARAAGVPRFVFISTCAVHEKILDDRKLDEAHPLWALTHYGAHKAAIEKFVHSYGFGENYAICSLRPTGIYGAAHPIGDSKWYDLVHQVKSGAAVQAVKGGKEVHAADVAKAVCVLLDAPTERVTGEAYNCYERYISDYEVATVANELTGANAPVIGEPMSPKHQIETSKLRALGMEFGGPELLRETVRQMLG